MRYRESILLLIAIFGMAVGVTSIKNLDWRYLLLGSVSSILAAVFSLCFVTWRDSKMLEGIYHLLDELTRRDPASQHFIRIGRNIDMGKNFWIEAIDELSEAKTPVYFVGTRLSRWLKISDYRNPLKEKLLARAKRASQSNEAGDWSTNIVLTDQDKLKEWSAFVKEEIEPKIKDKRTGVSFWLVDGNRVFYSAVICGRKTVITPYTRNRSIEDSACFELQPHSGISELYRKDIASLVSEIDRT